MRILWLNGGLLPDAAKALGQPKAVTAGWLASMLEAMRKVGGDNQYCILSLDYRKLDVQVGNVRYVTFGEYGKTYYEKVPRSIEKRCRDVIKEFNPDVIHVQGTEYFYGCMSPDVYCGKPVIVSLQGIISGCQDKYLGGLSNDEIWWTKFNFRLLRFGSTLNRDQRFWRECRAHQEAEVIKQNHFFIGRTDFDRAWVEYFNPKARYFTVNENLRDPFYRVKRDPERAKRHSIYCGAAAGYPLKGAHWLLRAVASLKNEFPDIELRIAQAEFKLSEKRNLIARLKDDSYAMYLRRLIKRLGVAENIKALPPLPAEEVARELCSAELFVLPSLVENSPNSLGEAMMIGTPVIATYVGGIPSVLENGVEGALVPSGDPAMLASKIREWFLHPERAQSGVAQAMDSALKIHDRETNARETLRVYREIIKEWNGRQS